MGVRASGELSSKLIHRFAEQVDEPGSPRLTHVRVKLHLAHLPGELTEVLTRRFGT